MSQPAWMEPAWAELGQREVAGTSDNARIVALYRDAGQPGVLHDEVAWCAAFVGASLERAGVRSSRSLMARSYLAWGSPLSAGRLGAIAVFSRGSDPATGHTGFYLDRDDNSIFVLGGNQGDAVSVTAIAHERLLGLRWPTAEGPPTGAAAAPTAVITTVGGDGFALALAHVLKMEGGWTEDPYDPGGPTNLGITLATLAAYRGVAVNAETFAGLKSALRAITDAEVRAIYRTRYWVPSRADALPSALALMHFDASVNHGVGASARMLQEAVDVARDGDIGPDTLNAIAAAPTAELVARYADIRRLRYRALGHFWRFGRGWLARVDRTATASLALINPQPVSQPKGRTTMTDIKETSTVPATKWWGESLTVWGAIITAASTVIPALGPVIGLDITGEMVRQLGGQAVQVVQALGGLAGTLMTIYGRVRATARIERRPVTVTL